MDSLKVTIIGCGDAFNSGGRLHTSFLLETHNKTVLIDCGATTLLGLKQRRLSTKVIDVIILSHFHGDHIAGVPFLLLDMARERRTFPLHIVCPIGGQDRIREAAHLFYPGSEDLFSKFFIRYHEFEGRCAFSVCDVHLNTFPVIHKAESKPHGLRIQLNGRVVAYSGDTEWTPTLVEIADTADLFICECTFFRQNVAAHLNYTRLQEHVRLLTAKKIVLTHFDEEMLNNLERLALPCAYDGMQITL